MVPIRISNVPLQCYRAIVTPRFHEKTVIASSPWEYISLWLRKNNGNGCLMYWEQAKNFWKSAENVSVNSAPLPIYYSFLNAAKVLLEVKGVPYLPYHGVRGFDMRRHGGRRVSIENEGIAFKRGGVLISLLRYYDEHPLLDHYSLSDILSNLAFIHRSYAINHNKKEIFLRINDPSYVYEAEEGGRFQAVLSVKNSHPRTLATLPQFFTARDPVGPEREGLEVGQKIIESSDRFDWSNSRRPTAADILSLTEFHRSVRANIQYVMGDSPFWYIKRPLYGYNIIRLSNVILIFMAMHRLSELARYKPIEFDRILKSKSNWVVHEFINSAPRQFFDEIISEITGCEIFEAGINRKYF